MIFVVTIDAEADNQWDHGTPLTTRNVHYWEPFHAICVKHGVTPTYLTTSEIAADPDAQSQLRTWVGGGTAEVGAHLHPWTTPPFVDEPGLRFNDAAHAFPSELPDELIARKLEVLTGEIEDGLGIRPTSFRAGRFGFDLRAARVLSRLGYVVDSSVTPLTDWRGHRGLPHLSGGPDFTAHSIRPFVVQDTGRPRLLELPVTIVPTHPLLRRFPSLVRVYRSLPMRAARKVSFGHRSCPQPVWLRPTPDHTQSDLRAAWHACQQEGSPVAVMMFHSSELMPAGSPYRTTESSVRDLLSLLDAFFGFVRDCGGAPASLTPAALELASSGDLQARRL